MTEATQHVHIILCYTCLYQHVKKKTEVGPYLMPYTKNNSKQTADLKVRAKTVKFLEQNLGGNLHDIQCSDYFLAMALKAQATKEKNQVN